MARDPESALRNVDVALTLFRKESWKPEGTAWTGALRPAALGRLRLRAAR